MNYKLQLVFSIIGLGASILGSIVGFYQSSMLMIIVSPILSLFFLFFTLATIVYGKPNQNKNAPDSPTISHEENDEPIITEPHKPITVVGPVAVSTTPNGDNLTVTMTYKQDKQKEVTKHKIVATHRANDDIFQQMALQNMKTALGIDITNETVYEADRLLREYEQAQQEATTEFEEAPQRCINWKSEDLKT